MDKLKNPAEYDRRKPCTFAIRVNVRLYIKVEQRRII